MSEDPLLGRRLAPPEMLMKDSLESMTVYGIEQYGSEVTDRVKVLTKYPGHCDDFLDYLAGPS